MPADLHIHTFFSDGLLSPEDVVKKAKEAGLSAIAITDHDCVDGIPGAIAAGKKSGVRVIPGVEFTTDVPGTEIHILGYYIDYKAEWLQDLLKKIRDDRVNRVGRIVAKLKAVGVDISEEEILKLAGKGSVGRPHVARALVKKGVVRTVQEAFNKYLDNEGPAYVPHFKLTPVEAVEAVKRAKGIPVFAHPGISEKDDIIPELVAKGLAGIEVFYSRHSDVQVQHYKEICEKYGLLLTGGSDFHGSIMRDISLGQITLSDDELAKLEARRES